MHARRQEGAISSWAISERRGSRGYELDKNSKTVPFALKRWDALRSRRPHVGTRTTDAHLL